MEIVIILVVIGAGLYGWKRFRKKAEENAANITIGIAQNALQDALIKRGFSGSELRVLVQMEGPLLAGMADNELRKNGDPNRSFLQQYREILPKLAEKHAEWCLKHYADKAASAPQRSERAYLHWDDWYAAFKDSAGKVKRSLATSDGRSIIDFMEDEPLRRAFRDGVDPVKLGEAFAKDFDPLKMGMKR